MAKIVFTAGRVKGFSCSPEKAQAFLWDVTAKGLGLRTTPAGKPTYVFQGVFQGRDLRITIGKPDAWTIPKAQEKARELQRMIDEGRDPREVKAEKTAADVARREAATVNAVTVGEIWPRYLTEGSPKRKDAFKPRYLNDLKTMSREGGVKKLRGQGVTRPGVLYPLMKLPLSQVNEDTLLNWFNRESLAGKHQAARGLMMFRGFLRWCAARPEYRAVTDRDAGRSAAIVEALPQVTKRTDCIEEAQLPGWFAGVERLENRTMAAYLKGLLLTGARREELAAIKWADVDFRWKKLTIADKVDLTRVIPLTPYMAHLLKPLPRTNDFVFASDGKRGHIADPRASHAKVMADAGIDRLTNHGLRRTFSLAGEAAGVPYGVTAQVMGHKPSGTAEGYRPRSLDVLRPYLEKIEAHILDMAGVVFDAKAAPGAISVVAM
jgi:integrase